MDKAARITNSTSEATKKELVAYFPLKGRSVTADETCMSCLVVGTDDLTMAVPSTPTDEPGRTRTKVILWFSILLLSLPVLYFAIPPFHAASAPVCPQAPPLVPLENGELWRRLDLTLKSESFLERAVNLLGGAVRVPTEVYDGMGAIGEDSRWEVFAPFHAYLRQSYPRIHATFELTQVNTYGLVYVWRGADDSLKPVLLTAHQDVVPVNPETHDQWRYPPYSGHFDGTYIWGRGSVDDKSGLISLMTAVELLLEHDFRPRRGIVLALGFDEEATGIQGAHAIAEHLLATYGQDAFAMLVDEGGEIEEQYGARFALPAIAEKGYVDIHIDVAGPGGHSSVPPAHTTIGILAHLLVHYERHAPAPLLSRGTPMYTHAQCLAAHAPELPAALRAAILDSATDDGALQRAQAGLTRGDPAFGALIGTTQAVDIVAGGVKTNALPETARAVVNHRIAVDSSVAVVQEHATAILKDLAAAFNLSYTAFGTHVSGGEAAGDEDAPRYGTLTLSDAWGLALEPAPLTPTGPGQEGAAFRLLEGTIRATYQSHRSSLREAETRRDVDEEIYVIPGLGSGNTDTHFYWNMTRNIFRYTHYETLAREEGSGMHTVNEACRADGLVEMMRFFVTLILNADESTML